MTAQKVRNEGALQSDHRRLCQLAHTGEQFRELDANKVNTQIHCTTGFITVMHSDKWPRFSIYELVYPLFRTPQAAIAVHHVEFSSFKENRTPCPLSLASRLLYERSHPPLVLAYAQMNCPVCLQVRGAVETRRRVCSDNPDRQRLRFNARTEVTDSDLYDLFPPHNNRGLESGNKMNWISYGLRGFFGGVNCFELFLREKKIPQVML